MLPRSLEPGSDQRARRLDFRYTHERVGFFSVRNVDYGRDEHEAKRRAYITRWRLEKKEPGAALSEPVKPIVWYIDSAPLYTLMTTP